MAEQVTSISLKDIAEAIRDELQLSSTDLLSVAQVTVSVTYQVDKSSDQDDCWLDDWYQRLQEEMGLPSDL